MERPVPVRVGAPGVGRSSFGIVPLP